MKFSKPDYLIYRLWAEANYLVFASSEGMKLEDMAASSEFLQESRFSFSGHYSGMSTEWSRIQ